MNESLKLALALAAVILIVVLLGANLFLMWNIYNRLQEFQDMGVLLSRIEKVESQVQMAEALARAAANNERKDKD